MFWVLKMTVSMTRFFEHPKHMLKIMGEKIFTIYAKKFCLCGKILIEHTKKIIIATGKIVKQIRSVPFG